jgi:branched-chain amino acid transport system substrate-binding protein
MKRFAAAVLAASSLALTAPAAAVDPYEIDGILPLTGNIAFVGQTELQALKGVEAYINRTGGINGRPIVFNILDDQNDPKTSVLLTQQLIAKNVPVIFGPSSPQSCAAVQPLIKSGPVQYCIAQAGTAPPGSYQFFTDPYDPAFAVTWRFFRERGWRKIAYIVSTDGGGQDAERTILAGAGLSENKDMQLVAREHFSPQDLSVSAQLARIKAANPDVLIAWGTGSPAGTLFRAEHDAGIDLPTYTSTGNLVTNFIKQYGAFFPPAGVFFATVPYYAGDANSRATRNAINVMNTELGTMNAKPDMVGIAAWDPAMLIVSGLRKFGTSMTATQLRDYLDGLRGWVGVNGPYDFRAMPQRGLTENSLLIVRWDPARNTAVAVSKFGGAALPVKN